MGNKNFTKPKKSGQSSRTNLLREIADLTYIPEVEEYISKALEEFKAKNPRKISKYRNLKQSLEKELEEKINGDGTKSKSYFFELKQVQNPQSPTETTWELGEFKLDLSEKVLYMIFSEFIAKTGQYEVDHTKIHTEFVYSYPLAKWLKINFTKSSDTRIVGFLKFKNYPNLKQDNNMIKIKTSNRKPNQKGLMGQIEDNP